MTGGAEPRLGPGAEFERILSLVRVLGARASGVGDDCALLDIGGEVLATSVDLSIENVHFRRDWLTLQEIGWRAVAGALSDLAAMGATPDGILTGIAVPGDTAPADIDECTRGIRALLEQTGGSVLGGDLSSGPVWTISVTVLGRVLRPVLRSGAAVGDTLWVTGSLGGSRAALESFIAGQDPPPPSRERFARPLPRLAAGAWLAKHGAHAMIDLSDGLAGDIRHLAAASSVAARVDLARLPLHPGVLSMAEQVGEDPAAFAAQGGEDYELLVALPHDFPAPLVERFESETGVPITRIGQIEAGEGVELSLAGHPLTIAGYDHFR
jgi:thiamine-monophosphate kinase